MPRKTTKTNRGRPQKIFQSRKPDIKRKGPGRPTKQETLAIKEHIKKQIAIHPIPEKKERKDLIILIIFLLSGIIFLFSLYIARSKQKSPTESPVQTLHATSLPPESGSLPTVSPEIEISPLIQQFITSINNLDLTTNKSLLTPALKNTTTIKTYFTIKRLSRFIDNLDEKKVTLINTTGSDTEIEYTIQYTLKNTQEQFTETRKATLVNNLISTIKCETPGCSKGPFFNPGKYF